jgi:hypothetical protein
MITTDYATFAQRSREMVWTKQPLDPDERLMDKMDKKKKPLRFNLCYGHNSKHAKLRKRPDVRIPEYEAGLKRYEGGISKDIELTCHMYHITDPEKLSIGRRVAVYKPKQKWDDSSGALVMGFITGCDISGDFVSLTPEYETYKKSTEIKVYIRPITRVRKFDECIKTAHNPRTFSQVGNKYWNDLLEEMTRE